MNHSLTIANTAISTYNNLFSLNDLHKASGNEKRHAPALFLRNDKTKELIAEIESENTIAYHTINGGKNRGTFVCEELVYAYAMWISAKFNLMVIRAFKALNTGAIPALAESKINDTQAYHIQKAIKLKCQHNSVHYQTIYHALYDELGVKSYKDILAADYESALAFIEQYQLADNMPNNAFWRMVGILEYERLSRELDALEKTLDTAIRQLTYIKRSKGLLYDALGEQRHISHDPELIAKARAFIDRQMAMKRRIGFI